ncbi:NADP-dependent malic enzyme [Legionella quinlivanii]|uniref:NADP-dependent malic enzyme n=1 Tax=Legionella quinlivanii TaxID=45073 RepID=A0A0W0Y6D6_9GAMM|nr:MULTISPECIES: malic enzyme-like NAD(P)-binding protein [Legionella]KTD52503.1 NADP-dependent malic enzyme [Legionella quinlivanii]MCE3044591.1 malate dehydrogenase [Legionella sp. 16cNR16C]MCW8451885.1 malate dehydrogenase [Legionella quinlivanii]RAP35004.1 malate dehydrogenase [Legionella quinlivanii]SEG24020.1 malate dehydrogenase (oxaloacetate-decarboxylating)(NADP+) [Legionella quinlivanii DSM 21216]
MDKEVLKQRALEYHEFPTPGKLGVYVTKPTNSQEDLSLAYTPGVAEPVLAIAEDPENAFRYTAKGNLIAVMTNGTAVLGLGDVGALASKPVMEGKAVLFKRFADIDVFDIEIDAENPQAFIATAKRIAPTFGGINLEDIKAPECFEIEQALVEQLSIPVFHDDQHGTAIVVAAALLNALELQNKKLADARIVCIGAGAAGIASMRLLVALGANKENMTLLDTKGVIHTGRDDLNAYKFAFARTTEARTLADALVDADVFIGVAKPDLLSGNLLNLMAPKPVIFALSNPIPEILPEVAHAIRDDIIIATGRSDYPNQVNNVLCFPYIFRGALDVRATCINQAMQVAAVEAIRKLVHEPVPQVVKDNYPGLDQCWEFGPHYIIPKPIDPRLKEQVSTAVAKAAIASGVSQIKKR